MLGEIICVGLRVSVSAAPQFNIVNREQKSKSIGIKLPLFRGGKGELEGVCKPPRPCPSSLSQPGLGSETQTAAEPPDLDPPAVLEGSSFPSLRSFLRSLQAVAHRCPPDGSQCPDGKTEACKGKGTAQRAALVRLPDSSAPLLSSRPCPTHRPSPNSPCLPRHLLRSLKTAPGWLYLPLCIASVDTLKMRCLSYLT